ncbi:hypothetical protein [Thermomonas sp.]
MSLHLRRTLIVAITTAILTTSACVATPGKVAPLAIGAQVAVDGTILAIDTDPWAYDGNAVVSLQTAANGPMHVQLPARWNLCKSGPVNVAALKVGQDVRVVGTLIAAGEISVCERAEHRLAPR